MSTVFLRLLASPPDEKAAALAGAITGVQEGGSDHSDTPPIAPESFLQVPTTTFAYWVQERIRHLFTELDPLEGTNRTAKQGLATADDFRFVRLWCEVNSGRVVGTIRGSTEEIPALTARCLTQTRDGKRWIPLAKGGGYSAYYTDVYLVVNWERDGEEIKSFVGPNGRQASRPQNTAYYFRPGLTWSLRSQRGLSVRALPAGCIFGHKGPGIFAPQRQAQALLGIANAAPFIEFVLMQTAFGSYEVGVLQRTPIPALADEAMQLSTLALDCTTLKATLDRANEVSHLFLLPALLSASEHNLATRLDSWNGHARSVRQRIAEHQDELDELAFRLYSIDDDDRRVMLEDVALQRRSAQEKVKEEGSRRRRNDEDDEDEVVETHEAIANLRQFVADLISYAVGCAFGRWDVCFATGERAAPELPDPFAPLPVCSPGMLTGDDGLPLREPPPGYPLAIAENGILVDDPGHPDDIVRRVHAVFELAFGEHAEATVREACAMLGVKELRDWFRNPRAFWDEHVKRYSKSRRKAPIYWLLQSSKRAYGLWLYYHRLDADLLYKALTLYVEPKVRLEEGELERLRAERAAAGAGGAAVKRIEREIDRQEALLAELHDFRDKLERAARLGLRPDLDDGVLLTIAPLHALVPWKPAKAAWDELLAGKYAWSSIGRQLREKGLVR